MSPSSFTAEVDGVEEADWYTHLDQFSDANIYQTWAYANVVGGRKSMSHLVLRRGTEVVAAAQARIARVPVISVGVAYVMWGPLWRRAGQPADPEIFRQALRALRDEYVVKRKLVLRLYPFLFSDGPPILRTILEEEGFGPTSAQPGRTIHMDLGPHLEELHEGMKPHWKRELKAANKAGLALLDSPGEEAFESFLGMYEEMLARKRFTEPNDIRQFRKIQRELPERFKMTVLVCASAGEPSAGLIASAMGDSAIYLFGATSNAGMKSRGSYWLQWKYLEILKQRGCSVYDLNGINPVTNPGTYKFKDDLAGQNGRDVFSLGRFETSASGASSAWLAWAERARSKYRALRSRVKSGLAPREILMTKR